MIHRRLFLSNVPPICIAIVLSALTASAADLPAPKADETGIVPGDIVLGNMDTYPGHAGLYLGKWEDLPQPLQTRFAKLREMILIRSHNAGLKDSYLVVDSDGGRGVRVTPLVEQFTGYFPKLRSVPNVAGGLEWESKKGGAVAWPTLPLNDPRRWKIVEEALMAAAAKVPYDARHGQWTTTSLVGETRRDGKGLWVHIEMPYEDMKDGLDCIAMVHLAYWRGARIDVDVSWMPYHDPKQLYNHAKSNHLLRAVRLEPVYIDGAVLGTWHGKVSFDSGVPQIGIITKPAHYCCRPKVVNGRRVLDQQGDPWYEWTPTDPNNQAAPIDVQFVPQPDGAFELRFDPKLVTQFAGKLSLKFNKVEGHSTTGQATFFNGQKQETADLTFRRETTYKNK